MSKKLAVIAMAGLIALCLALVGCSSASEKAAAKAAFAGTWDLVEMDNNGEITSQEDIELMKSFGLEVYVNLNEDDSAQLVLFDTPLEGTWEASSETAGKITLEDQSVDMTIEESRLTFLQEGIALIFEKGEAKAPVSSESASASGESASASSSVS